VGDLSRLPRELLPVNFIEFDREEINQSIPDRFEKQVALYPDHLAVKHGDSVLTYQGLNRASNQLARVLLERTKRSDSPIAFLIEHGISQIVAILGILKTGCPYVALDPSFPLARLEFILRDSQASILVTNNENLSLVDEFTGSKYQIVNLDEVDPDSPWENPGIQISPESPATILYTSGSTGQPKGCIRPHRNMLHATMGDTNRLFINSQDRLGLLLSASYAAFEVPTYGALLNGACLFPFDIKKEGFVKIKDWLANENISILVTVPSTFRNFVSTIRDAERYDSLRLLFTGGEPVLKLDVDLYKKFLPPDCYMNVVLAGTEFQRIRSYIVSKNTTVTSRVVPVGYEVEDKQVILLDEDGKAVPVGEVGEITVESQFLSPGYWNQPELTKSSFLPVPNQEGITRFRTGDLGRMRPDGCLEHLGRKDRQVKIRGHRVELAEILSDLLEISVVEDAYVMAQPDDVGENQLVAYIVPIKTSVPTASNIRDILAKNLPSYMLPAEYVFLSELPRTPTGKVDALALPVPEKTRTNFEGGVVEPQTALEEQLVAIWETVLKIHPVSIRDDFFDLGGHSLLALRLIAAVEEELGIIIPFPALIQARTIANIARIIQDQEALTSWSHLVALQPLGSKLPLFCIPPSAVTVMIFKDLAKYLDRDRPFYGLEYSGMEGETSVHDSIPEMARYNLERIRSLQPCGPYYLGGMCFGGLVAYEMAKQLLADGEEVAFLGILDSTHAPYLTRPSTYPLFMITRFLNQKILRKKFPLGMAPLKRAMRKFSPDDKLGNRIYEVFTTHNYARVKYVTTPYPGKITLFNTKGSRGDFSRDQWKAVAAGGLAIVTVPGVHAGAGVDLKEGESSFVMEPHVRVLAHKINESLESV
jgi:amino acid adenylation domain-containing protein